MKVKIPTIAPKVGISKKNSLPTNLLKTKNLNNNKLKTKPLNELKEDKRNMPVSLRPNYLKSKATKAMSRNKYNLNLIKDIRKEKSLLTTIVKVDLNKGRAKTEIGRKAENKPITTKNKFAKTNVQSKKIDKNQKKKKWPRSRKFKRRASLKAALKDKNDSSLSQCQNQESENFHSQSQSQLNLDKVSSTVNSFLKQLKQKSQNKAELLDLEEPIFLQVECIKIPICPGTKQLRFKLPNPLVNELSDVLLITADKKGAKIHPERAVEHYTDLLDQHDIKFIQKVMPLRMLRQEYSQYEMKRKLVDQFDVILADANILPSLPKILGGFALFSKKMPIPVHLDRKNLKQHLQNSLSKTQMTYKAKGNISIVQVGHTKMAAEEIAANIVEVNRLLKNNFPGGWRNVRSLYIKTATSDTQAIYISLVSPNDVRVPVLLAKKPKPVEDELSTCPDKIVVVKADGNVFLKEPEKKSEELETQFDDELIQAAQKYIQSSKTVRYDSDEEDNDAVEEDFLKNYEAAKRANAVNSDEENEDEGEQEEEEEEEEEESDDEEPVVPPVVTSKKRKMDPAKKQVVGKSPNKKQKLETKNSQQQKKQSAKPSPMGKPQRRGARGKKTKMSKDQRKALIKRKKAGKN